MTEKEDQLEHAASGRCEKHRAALVAHHDARKNTDAVSCPLCEVEELDRKIMRWAILGGEDE
jgi:hypothetical protein